MNPTQLNEIAALAAHYVNTTDRHIFLTGKAGTGKTTFLKYIVDHTYKNTAVAAPTGIAAINAGGVTLHSLLQLPFGTFVPENIPIPEGRMQLNTPKTLGQRMRFSQRKRALLRELELLIIDEVSMLRADLLDCIDLTLRSVRRRKSEPFGGLQLLFIGDLMQLPPVVKEEEKPILSQYYRSSYFFEAHALRAAPPLSVELQKIYRQSDQVFIDLLNRLRHNQQTEADLERLNQHFDPEFCESNPRGYIHLTTHNHKADRINQRQLDDLPGKAYRYEATVEGDFPENLYPLPQTLELKLEAQVMFVKNDPSGEGRFFNGKIGQVSRLENDRLWVRFDDTAEEIEVETHEWENKRFTLNEQSNEVDEQTLGRFIHFPLKLAWAVTVHKSQGLTFEKAILDVAQTFAPGQLYVALSRLTSLEGLRLASPLPQRPPAIDATLRAFIEDFPDQQQLEADLQRDRRTFLRKLGESAFDFRPLLSSLAVHRRSFDKAENRSAKQQHLPWTEQLIADTEPLEDTGAKFIRQVNRLLQEDADLNHLHERSQKALGYFEPKLQELSKRVQTQLHSVAGQRQLKSYREELETLVELFALQIRMVMKFCLLVQESAAGRMPSKEQLREWEQRHGPPRLPKPKKKPTAEISYEHFRAGKSVEEIAAERDLTVNTIFGHLVQYVEKGLVPIERLIDTSRLPEIEAAIEACDPPLLSAIKARLPEEISYEQIKAVLAHRKREDAELETRDS